MAGPAFDPSGAVRFDLKSGAASDAQGSRLVVLPSSALEALERTSPEGVVELGNELGRVCGERVAFRLGGDAGVRAAQLEIVISHLAGELAVAGVGALHLERWGRALVCVVENPSHASDAFVSAVLAGALSAASGRDVAVAPLARNGARYFVGAPRAADRVRMLAAQGKGHAEILGALQGGAS